MAPWVVLPGGFHPEATVGTLVSPPGLPCRGPQRPLPVKHWPLLASGHRPSPPQGTLLHGHCLSIPAPGRQLPGVSRAWREAILTRWLCPLQAACRILAAVALLSSELEEDGWEQPSLLESGSGSKLGGEGLQGGGGGCRE